MTTYKVGDRVRLARDVERYPNFIAKAATGGTVVEVRQKGDLYAGHVIDLVRVRMDKHLPGCEEWSNHIHWYDDFLSQLEGDLVLADNTSIHARAHCPFCGREQLSRGRGWLCTPMVTKEDEDDGAEAVITEYHCEHCGKSFGLFQ